MSLQSISLAVCLYNRAERYDMTDTRKIVDSILTPADTLSAMQKKASSARAAQNWAAELYWRRRLSEASPNDASALHEYARVLGQLGYHSRAKEVLRRAAALSSATDFEAAITGLDAAFGRLTLDVRDGGGQNADTNSLAALLQRIAKTHRSALLGQNRSFDLYISTPAPIFSEFDAKSMAISLGLSDYSYGFILRGFVQALEELGVDFQIIENPHYISDVKTISSAATVVHLAICPPERIRLLKGAYNVVCCAWEFDRLRQTVEQTNIHPFSDQSKMLDLADEVWLISEHGADSVAKTVRPPVFAVSSPVLENHVEQARPGKPSLDRLLRKAECLEDVVWRPLAVLPRYQSRMNREAAKKSSSLRKLLKNVGLNSGAPPVVFYTMFNAHDYRKQIRPLLDAFIQFSIKNPNALLLMKVASVHADKADSFDILRDQLHDPEGMIPPLISDRIWLTTEIMSREQLNALMDIGAYYVSTSHAEGQNLPLIEAMLRGAVPVSVDHTAMSNYIAEDNAVIIRSEEKEMNFRLAKRYNLYNVKTNFVSPNAVEMALDAAISMSDGEYSSKSTVALEKARETFGTNPFQRSLNDTISRAKLRSVSQ
jgi:hypothetical protein